MAPSFPGMPPLPPLSADASCGVGQWSYELHRNFIWVCCMKQSLGSDKRGQGAGYAADDWLYMQEND